MTIIVLISSACSKNQQLNILEFSDNKSKNNYAEIYTFDDTSKLYSEFSNINYIKDDGKKVLIPFRKEFIKDVFDDAIEVFYLEGLV